ncbi:MAG TPA: substrate-binding domain-containing protein [Leptolyngbyaceae cyanobacterium]
MSKVVVLSLDDGNFNEGFRVTLEIGEDGQPPIIGGIRGKLPPAPEVSSNYDQWQRNYRSLGTQNSRLERLMNEKLVSSENLEEKIKECRESFQGLKESINNWLKSNEFLSIERRLLRELSRTDEIRVIVRTTDSKLRKLPWDTWEFFEDFPNAAVAISPLEHDRGTLPIPKERVKILAILGNSSGINIEKDRQLLERLPQADVSFLVEPQRQEFETLWDRNWDILFFAGHSSSQSDGETGQIFINRREKLAINELKKTLKIAIRKGLQLAIFNSCDGLGLARELEKLNIPQIIVMREPVPDQFAQEFLRYFLEAFSGGKSLYVSVREAQEKLHELSIIETNFPGASCLPVICQNPSAVPVTWQELLKKPEPDLSLPQPPQPLSLPQSSPPPSSVQKGSRWFVMMTGFMGGAIFLSAIAWWLTRPICSYTDIRLNFLSDVPKGELFNYGGSTTWAPIRDRLDPAIQVAWPGLPGRYVPTQGSGDGIQKLIQGQLTFSQSSRPLLKEEIDEAKRRGFSLDQERVAMDAIAVAVNPQLKIPGLTVDQLKGIYTGTINNWQQVGGPNLPITPYSRREKDAGTVEFFIQDFLRKPLSDQVKLVDSTTVGLRAVATTPGGIYYASAPEVVPQCMVRSLPLGYEPGRFIPPYQGNLVPPELCPQQRTQVNKAAFKTGKYPITRNLFVIIKDFEGDKNSEERAGRAYANLLLTDKGQAMLEETGFVPIRPTTCPSRY